MTADRTLPRRAAPALAHLALLAAACGAGTHPVARPRAPDEVVRRLVEAFDAHDPERVRAVFAPDARATLIGDAGPVAIAPPLAAIFARYPDAHLALGRLWIGAPATVVELVFRGTCAAGPLLGVTVPARPVAVAGAAVLTFDRDGRVNAVRLYVDIATVLGQIDPALLPAGADVRPLEPDPRPSVFEARGTPAEASNLARANAIWAALDAHDVARVMAGAAPAYRYVDFAAPRVLGRAETHQMVDGFLAAVSDFRIADKPVHLAAGDYVVTEMIETAKLAGRPITLHGLDIKRFVKGAVAEEWQYSNYVEILTQVRGMAPPNLAGAP
jgi:SnoaL-like domain